VVLITVLIFPVGAFCMFDLELEDSPDAIAWPLLYENPERRDNRKRVAVASCRAEEVEADRGFASRQSFYLIETNLVPVGVIKITERDCGAPLRDWELCYWADFDAPLSKQCARCLEIIHANSQDMARTLLT
jgi:hypothetical protein